MAVADVARSIRNVKRYTEIIDVLVRNGFADVVGRLGLDRLVRSGYRLVGRDTGALTQPLSAPARMRQVLEQLGPTFMKLGQMLSCRQDLVPDEWADEFAKLQAEGPMLPFEAIQTQLAEEFEGRESDLFASIDEVPIAAASMAQVHRAMLRDGTPVVLKILRPGTEERTHADLEILTTIAEFAESHFGGSGFRPTDIVKEFARELKHEVDLTYEGRNTDKLREAFKDDNNVRFPRVYWEATTRRILALEEFKGILLSRLTDRDLTPEQRTEVVAHGAAAVARQCLEIGLFHADPHPGNLFALIRDDGHITAGFIDCGMTGRLEPRTMEQLARLVKAIAEANVDDAIAQIGAIASVEPRKLEEPALRADIAELVRSFEVTSFDRFNLPALLSDLFHTMRTHRLRFPAELILLIKALTTIESVGRMLDPSFDLVAHMRPSIEEAVRRQFGVRAIRRRVRRGIEQYATLLEGLPNEVRTLLDTFRRGNVAVQLQHRGLAQLTRTLEHASRNIGFALIITGLVVASAILIHASGRDNRAGLQTLGVAGFITAAFLSLGYLLANRRWMAVRKKGSTDEE